MACICGPNGAGKSSLLEAIAWALWGQARALDDQIIHRGALEVWVSLIFRMHHQVYRVIRARQRGQTTTLEFQVATSTWAGADALASLADQHHLNSGELNLEQVQFRSLTAGKLRATQQRIIETLCLDYDTFINSAYLRQGRADEFMLKRPAERKQILADLLKLDQYDRLADLARETSRNYCAQAESLVQQLDRMATQLAHQGEVAAMQRAVEQDLAQLQQAQTRDQSSLKQLQTEARQRQGWQQQLEWYQKQQATLTADCQQLQQECGQVEQESQSLEHVIQKAVAIAAAYAEWQALQQAEELAAQKLQASQQLQSQRQQLQAQHAEAVAYWRDRRRELQAQLAALQQQQAESETLLAHADEVKAALAKLQAARQRLTELDQLHDRLSPLLKRRQQIQTKLELTETRLVTRLEELQATAVTLTQQQLSQSEIAQQAQVIASQINYLEQRRRYQRQVQERGMERRTFMERLQAHQRDYETQLAKLDQKIQLLKQPNATCPLCDRELDQHHWDRVLHHHQVEYQEAQNSLWVLRDQLAAAEREIQILRQEYREVGAELASYDAVLEQRGQLQQQLQAVGQVQSRLQALQTEMKTLAQTLEQQSYSPESWTELQELDQEIAHLCGDRPYDERDHALARGEVDRWRWAEIRQGELRQAQKRLDQLADRQPQLEAELAQIAQQLNQLQTSPQQQELDRLDRQIAELGYDPEQHRALRAKLRQTQIHQTHYQALCQAQQRYPQVQQRLADLVHRWQLRQAELDATIAQCETIRQQLANLPDRTHELATLENQIQARRQQMDQHLAQLGRLQQQTQHLAHLQTQQADLRQQLQQVRYQQRIYQELAQAFGKNGLQAAMIETLLPQLEVEANHLLARLSANQLHVQFVTQRATRQSHRSKTGNRLIETLDILIADAHGTRPYETYSGGEAFRVNFAIRLALSRLLAQRSGTALQLLIVDEGFGTQDQAGCDRLIAALQAIAADFACVLMVTHMPHLKEAFQVHIEVSKDEAGSQLTLVT